MMIAGYVVGGEQAVARFAKLPASLRAQLAIGVQRAILRIQSHTKEDKLSGQVLNVRTGRLRRSITQRMTETEDRVTGIVGTNVEYARAHEFGFTGTVSVREHLRMAKSGEKSPVRAHNRNVRIPEKSFLRSSLADEKDSIRLEIEQAVHRAMKP